MKGMFNFGLLGIRRVFGGVMPPKPSIDKWVKEHMVFWYDMSKPVDTYIPGVTYANPFVNGGGKITYDNAINKCIITHTPTNNNNISFWQIIVKPLQYVESYKIRVTGLPTGFTIKGRLGYDIQITSDGEYDIPEYRNSSTTNTSYPGFYFAGDNVNDVDCNIVVEEIPTRQSVPTNEILKANPYLQDHSGNNRPLKLNNFLFAAMSGVGGYEYNWLDSALFITYLSGARGDGTITDNTITINNVKVSSGVIETRVNSPSKKYKVRVTGITSNETLRYVIYGDTSLGELATIIFDMKKDGEYELPASTYSATYNMKWQVIAASYPHTCNITIEQIPSYPNALVTDGVDDYGVVENFKSLQNYMMFFQCAIIRPNTTNGMFSTTSIESGTPGWMLLQGNSAYYVRFGNNVYKTFNVTSSIGNKISYVLSANNGLMTCYVGEEKATQAGTYSQTGANMSLFLSDIIRKTRFGSMAFYKSILFDSVPTKETDGFTEQDLITWVIDNMINGTPQSGVFPYVFPLKVN